jgi:hypothetical protein
MISSSATPSPGHLFLRRRFLDRGAGGSVGCDVAGWTLLPGPFDGALVGRGYRLLAGSARTGFWLGAVEVGPAIRAGGRRRRDRSARRRRQHTRAIALSKPGFPRRARAGRTSPAHGVASRLAVEHGLIRRAFAIARRISFNPPRRRRTRPPCAIFRSPRQSVCHIRRATMAWGRRRGRQAAPPSSDRARPR